MAIKWAGSFPELEHECCSGDRCEAATVEALRAIAEQIERCACAFEDSNDLFSKSIEDVDNAIDAARPKA